LAALTLSYTGTLGAKSNSIRQNVKVFHGEQTSQKKRDADSAGFSDRCKAFSGAEVKAMRTTRALNPKSESGSVHGFDVHPILEVGASHEPEKAYVGCFAFLSSRSGLVSL
jgi:hypothetical protein